MTGESKVGDIVLDRDKTTCRALLRPADGSPKVLLCTINLAVYDRHTILREQFINLAGAVAVNLNQPGGSTVIVHPRLAQRPAEQKIDRRSFACWECRDARAADARQRLSSYSDADLQTQLSPRGNPLFCCRVSLAAVA